MAFEEDLDEFLDTEDFAVSAVIGASNFNGILTDEYIEVLGFEGRAPVFVCKESDVADLSVQHGSILNIDGTLYQVRGVQPDGTGMTTLILEEPL